MSTPYRRGKRAESELVKRLWRAGYAVMRAPASGAKVKRVFYPDVFAVKFDGSRHKVLIFEVKLRRDRMVIHIPAPKVWMLQNYARRSGGEAYIAVKVASEKRWFVFPIDVLEQQRWEKGLRFVITKQMYEKAMSLSDVI